MDMINFFDKYADNWDDNYSPNDPIRTSIATLSGAGSGKKVLDIACGTGVMFKDLLKLDVESITGIDISNGMTEVAKVKFKDESKVNIIREDIMKFSGEEFDVAIMFNAYPHFLDKDAMINHVSGLLRKGGRFTVAHGAGKEVINQCHSNVPTDISSRLLPAAEEAEKFKKYFNIDIVVDTPYCYMISGIKRD